VPKSSESDFPDSSRRPCATGASGRDESFSMNEISDRSSSEVKSNVGKKTLEWERPMLVLESALQ
jgi:hypothetical protein